MMGVLAQFFYVGAQVCINSFFIRFSERVAGVGGLLPVCSIAGIYDRQVCGHFYHEVCSASAFAGCAYSFIVMLLLLLAVNCSGIVAVYGLIAVQFFLSIMFPTIFALSVRGSGAKTKEGSLLVIMSIFGGAVFPVIMGRVSDASNILVAYGVPAACMLVVLAFAFKDIKVAQLELSAAHHHACQ